jgi:hypothetical protein
VERSSPNINGRLFFRWRRVAHLAAIRHLGNRWHHVAVVINTAGDEHLYVDGLSSGSRTNTQVRLDTDPGDRAGPQHDPYWLRYNGLPHDVRFYNRHHTGEIALPRGWRRFDGTATSG